MSNNVTQKYMVVSLDVWGNKKDGFEVNDAYKTSNIAEIGIDYSNKDVLKALKKSGYISSYQNISVDPNILCNDFTIYIVEKKNGRPFCELHLIDNEAK